MKNLRFFLIAALVITAITATALWRSTSAAGSRPSASGHGTILLQDTDGKTVTHHRSPIGFYRE